MRYFRFGIIVFLLLCFTGISYAKSEQTLHQRIKNAIREYILDKNSDWKSEKINIVFALNTRIAKRLSSYGKDVDFIVPEIYSNSKITPNIILPIQVLEDDAERERIFVRTQIKLFADVVTAKNSLKKGSSLASGDLQLKEKNVLQFGNDYFSTTSPLLGKQTAGYVRAGSVITKRMIKTIPAIKRNHPVTIIVKEAGLMIEAAGVALEDGSVGDLIKVKRKKSKDVIQGKVNAPGKVEVEL